MSPRDAVLQQAMNLAEEEERAFVADALERSLPPAPFVTDEIAAAWSQELDRRMSAYLSGETTSVSFDESLQFLRSALAEHRARRAES